MTPKASSKSSISEVPPGLPSPNKASTASDLVATADNEADDSGDNDSYIDPSDNDLNVWQGAALLTADCLGTGILALPADIYVLGSVVGLGFLVTNLPINLYAGTILSHTASHVEATSRLTTEPGRHDDGDDQLESKIETAATTTSTRQQVIRKNRPTNYDAISTTLSARDVDPGSDDKDEADGIMNDAHGRQQQHHHSSDLATFDFIGMTEALMSPRAVAIVMAIYYTNIFLVLGDYVLVMSHAVVALLGQGLICLPTAGILASTLMFVVTQARTMANLGRSISIMSLTALFIVIVQCLVALHHDEIDDENMPFEFPHKSVSESSVLAKFSAIASIGFAVGSQKLFLNIRHEMADRESGPKSLAISLSVFGAAYVIVCVVANAGREPPPSFLLDAIPVDTINRRVAGFFLWIHVVVSYAINSQAICSSMDRLFFHKAMPSSPRIRWSILTALMAVSSYIVANAVPFFKDLVALIGALTSVPLTLLLPALLYRKMIQAKYLCLLPGLGNLWSWLLVIFSIAFLIAGLAGALGSIEMDWSNHGPPFSCH